MTTAPHARPARRRGVAERACLRRCGEVVGGKVQGKRREGVSAGAAGAVTTRAGPGRARCCFSGKCLG